MKHKHKNLRDGSSSSFGRSLFILAILFARFSVLAFYAVFVAIDREQLYITKAPQQGVILPRTDCYSDNEEHQIQNVVTLSRFS